jgi:DNA polymerase/3'-5' exonuclease PolX
MNNTEAAQIFLELADRVDLAGELPFKGASYRKVARSLMDLTEPFQLIVRQMEYGKIAGAGKTIKEKLATLAMTDKLPALEKWRTHETSKFYAAIKQYGIGSGSLGRLIKKYQAKDIAELIVRIRESGTDSLSGQIKETALKILA